MTQPDWPTRLVAVTAGEVRRHRQRRGLSAQQLSDSCADLGLPIARSVLANLESGRRTTVTLPELLVLAKVLRVAPVQLVFPVGHAASIEVLPGVEVPTWEALRWFTGEHPAAPGHEISADDWQTGGNVLALHRLHEREMNAWHMARNRAEVLRERGDSDAAAAEERRAAEAEERLRITRQYMRQAGVTVMPSADPVLPSDEATS